MIDRYRPTVAEVQATAYCGLHPDGEYVKASDYDALAARLAEQEVLAQYPQDGDGSRHWVNVGTWLYPGDRVLFDQATPTDSASGVWEVTSYAALMNEHVALQGRCTYLAARLESDADLIARLRLQVDDVTARYIQAAGQRDTSWARLAEAERDAEKWRKAQDMALLIYDKHLRGVTQSFLRTVNEYVDGIRATDSASGGVS